MTQLSYIVTLFLSALLETLPFLLLGILVSSWLLVFVDERQFALKLPRNSILGAIFGSGLGMILPVGQYGNIPVTRRLLLHGVPIPIAISFLVAASTVNPIVLWSTWKAFRAQPEMIFLRVMLAWVIAFVIGCIFSTYQDKLPIEGEIHGIESRSTLLRSGSFLESPPQSDPLHRVGNLVYDYQSTTHYKPWKLSLNLFVENVVRESIELGSFLGIGCAIASIGQAFLPQAALLNWVISPVTQILAMLLLGAVWSISSVAASFSFSFSSIPFLKGSLLAFLLFGSIIDIKALALMLSVFRPKFVLYLLILAGQSIFLFALFVNFYID
ncbi:permease [Candidatus Gracilibacteria bacterium]|nr:permease [Candidatus Gracilibacteria bacterium]NJM86604.1 permease [Hydrococcus sp. RU_2_2]NJP21425.1 permease [Hydrococcus sp. CRU_1_1]